MRLLVSNSDNLYVNNDVLSSVAEVFMDNPKLDACYADLIYTDKSNTARTVRYWKSGDFFPGAFSGWCPPHPTIFSIVGMNVLVVLI